MSKLNIESPVGLMDSIFLIEGMKVVEKMVVAIEVCFSEVPKQFGKPRLKIYYGSIYVGDPNTKHVYADSEGENWFIDKDSAMYALKDRLQEALHNIPDKYFTEDNEE